MLKNKTIIAFTSLILSCVIGLTSCGGSVTDPISTNTEKTHEHVVVIDKAVTATCTATGLTEGSHCSICNEVIVEQRVVSKINHSYGDWETISGKKVRECSICHDKEYEDLPAKTLYTKNGDTIFFGTYPQTLVNADDRNGLSSIVFNSEIWTDYGYYINNEKVAYTYYLDVDTDKDGSYDYRGVYFTQYRPHFTSDNTSTTNQEQADNNYSTNTIYWFRYEPIAWNIVETKDNKALLVADVILDSQYYHTQYAYNAVKGGSDYQNNSTSDMIYTNNYKYSYIRSWLNTTFTNTAFYSEQMNCIETTMVDNSSASINDSTNSCLCEDTGDKIFLLSEKEVNAYYTTSNARCSSGTDYAKALGLYKSEHSSYLGNSVWWTRSTYKSIGYSLVCNTEGRIDNYPVNSCYGVRPACWINLGNE